jgi:CcmD family protein
LDNLGFLGLAFLLVWVGIVAYLLTVTRRQRALERRLEELEKRNNRD